MNDTFMKEKPVLPLILSMSLPMDVIHAKCSLRGWNKQKKYHNGEINREDYDKWRYNYPKYDETSGYVKVPSQQFSDALVEAFEDRLKND